MTTRDLKNLTASFLLSTKPTFYGTMMKRNKKGKFKYRFCIIFNGCFVYYLTKKSRTPKGFFYLNGYRVSSTSSTIDQSRMLLELSHAKLRNYIFEVDNEDVLKQWVEHLNKVIFTLQFPPSKQNVNHYVDHFKRTPSVSSSASSNSSSSRGGAAPSLEKQAEEVNDDKFEISTHTQDNIHKQPCDGAKERMCYEMDDDSPLYDHPRTEEQYEYMYNDPGIAYESMGPIKNDANPDEFYEAMGSVVDEQNAGNAHELYFEEDDDDDEDDDDYLDLTDGSINNELHKKHTKPVLPAPVTLTLPPVPARRLFKKEGKNDVDLQTLKNVLQKSVSESEVIYDDVRTESEVIYDDVRTDDRLKYDDTDEDYLLPDIVLEQGATCGDELADRHRLSDSSILPPSVYHRAFDKNLCASYFAEYPLGVYLIRTDRGDGIDALSVKTATGVKHYFIFIKNGTFYLERNEPAFVTVAELVRYYYTNSLPTCDQMLTTPYR